MGEEGSLYYPFLFFCRTNEQITDDFHGEIVSFNLDYLNEGISSIQSDRVIMYFNKNNTPSIFEGLDNKEYKYMIMPIIKPNH